MAPSPICGGVSLGQSIWKFSWGLGVGVEKDAEEEGIWYTRVLFFLYWKSRLHHKLAASSLGAKREPRVWVMMTPRSKCCCLWVTFVLWKDTMLFGVMRPYVAARSPGFKQYLQHLLVLWSGVTHSVSPSSISFICKIGMIIETNWTYWTKCVFETKVNGWTGELSQVSSIL